MHDMSTPPFPCILSCCWSFQLSNWGNSFFTLLYHTLHLVTPSSTQVRLGSYASDVYMPPSAIVASKAMANDPRAEPKYCERVPYVVVAGPAGARLMDLVRSRLWVGAGGGKRKKSAL